MKKFLRYLMVASIIAVVLVMTVTQNKSIADVGSFEDYDSGSSWSSGSSSSSDSWSSSSSSSSSSYSSGSSSSGGGSYGSYKPVTKEGILKVVGVQLLLIGMWFILIIIIVQFNKHEKKNKHNNKDATYTNILLEKIEKKNEEEIKKKDNQFDKDKFLAWASDLFIKMQETWTTGDWSQMRLYETNELYEQHLRQIQGYIDRNQMNIMDKISVQSAILADFYQTGDKDILTVIVQSKMLDYIVDKTTGKVLKGDKTTFRYGTYKMEFIRKTGVKTSDSINTVQCPNCGAKTQITVSGKCEYCGSVLTTGEYNWALSNLERTK